MWYNSIFFKRSIKILSVLWIVFLFFLVIPYFYPVINFVKYIFSCLIFGIALYYLFRPVVSKLSKYNVPFSISMACIYIFMVILLIIIGIYVLPVLTSPIAEVATRPKEKAHEVQEATIGLLSYFNLPYQEIRALVTSYLVDFQKYLFQNAYEIFSAITHVALMLVLTPFTLYYFMKDDRRFHRWFIDAIPHKYQPSAERILEDVDQTLLAFFHGQLTIASIVTGLALIGLYLIGMENVAFLTFLTFLLSLIPYLGTLLAIIPPTIEGFTISYTTAILAASVMTLIHLTESNIITPQVMMKRFDIHPLTIILLIITSFFFFGLFGPLWITPAYVLIREFISDAASFFESSSED